MSVPEGTVDDSDQDGLPDEGEDDDPCTPADIFRSKTEDLGGDIQQK